MARILVGSWAVRYPLGGNLSWTLQWLLGFHRLGHDQGQVGIVQDNERIRSSEFQHRRFEMPARNGSHRRARPFAAGQSDGVNPRRLDQFLRPVSRQQHCAENPHRKAGLDEQLFDFERDA